ncbi:CASP8 and FADD-like apoptosis regulator [Pungitius pungitius]|uniref:CASP8 and FADD-like apoptosis regulator n=1 Tax=Pungitius pungitius TaxID=134920 RepID=UPI002E10CA62
MALPDQCQLQAIHQTAAALDSRERSMLFYLCGVTDANNTTLCVEDFLRSRVIRHERAHLFLTELMLQLGRFDILRDVYKTSRDEVEKSLAHRRVLPSFRVLMANINEGMDHEDLNSVKFLWGSTLSREKIENAQSFIDLIIELEKLDKVSPGRVDFVEECLINIGRVDLAKKVTAYKMSAVTSEGHTSLQQRHRAPCPFPTPNGSPCLQQTLREHPIHNATENISAPVYREQSQLEFYKCNTDPRGVCVIIDCVGNDGDTLEQTFKALHFNVLLHRWLSGPEAFSVLRGIFSQRENLRGDCFVCCIISRGTANHLLGTDSYGAGLHLDDVRRLFNGDACPALAGKPKVFLIQRYDIPEIPQCAGTQHRDEDLETDGWCGLSRCDVVPTDGDVFWSHCWTGERQLERGDHSSVYLKVLRDALHKGQRRKTHLLDVHTEVNGAIFEHNKRNPGAHYHIELKHTLRKELYLH